VWQGGDRPFPTSDTDPRGRDKRLCRLVLCLLEQDGVLRWLKQAGIDPQEVKACVREFCASPPVTRPAAASLETRLRELVRDDELLRALVARATELEEPGGEA
jgi:hypothetical protein